MATTVHFGDSSITLFYLIMTSGAVPAVLAREFVTRWTKSFSRVLAAIPQSPDQPMVGASPCRVMRPDGDEPRELQMVLDPEFL